MRFAFMKARNLYFCSLFLLLAACSSLDLAFINEVKRFEPQWMTLSEKAAFIEQKLSITGRRYPRDLALIDERMNHVGGDGQPEAYGLRSQYRRVMADREKLADRFETEKKTLTEQVKAFNDWETRLMKGEWGEDKAKRDFEAFKQRQQELQREINDIQSQLIKNIETHNAILRRLAQLLEVYNNFDIDVK